MKTNNLKSAFILIFALLFGLYSCEGDMGPAGPAGQDGIDGVNGEDGVDGEDGNANVHTYIFNNPSWVSGSSFMDINMPDVLTDDVITNDVILGYVKTVGNPMVNQIPGYGFGDKDYRVFLFGGISNKYRIVSYNLDGTVTAVADLEDFEWVKIVVISASNVTTVDGNTAKGQEAKKLILEELKNANVDIADYDQVINYYGITE